MTKPKSLEGLQQIKVDEFKERFIDGYEVNIFDLDHNQSITEYISSLIDEVARETIEATKLERKIEKMIEPCENCGGEGYGKAWYGHGEATGDAWGDLHKPTGSVVFCKECANDFQIGCYWEGEKIWKRTSDSEEHAQIRLSQITKTEPKYVGYNQAESDQQEKINSYLKK